MVRQTVSPPGVRRRRGRPRLLVLLVLLGLLPTAGCALPSAPSMAAVPRAWRDHNPWGPEGNAAREAGEWQPLFYTDDMAAWAEFARQNLEDGDLLFRYGASSDIVGWFIAVLSAGIADSPFSHTAIVRREGDHVYVLDNAPPPQRGRKMPFEFWVLDNVPGSLAVTRLKPEYRHHIPPAMALLEDIYILQPPFDYSLRPDDERLYCSEMIEKSFRATGLALSEPVTIRCLPHYRRWAVIRPVAERVTELRVDQPVVALGNQHYGLYGSPHFDVVFSELCVDREARRKPPRCPPGEHPAVFPVAGAPAATCPSPRP